MVEEIDCLQNWNTKLDATSEVLCDDGNIELFRLLDVQTKGVGLTTRLSTVLRVKVDHLSNLTKASRRPSKFVAVKDDLTASGIPPSFGLPYFADDSALFSTVANGDIVLVDVFTRVRGGLIGVKSQLDSFSGGVEVRTTFEFGG